MSIERPLGRGSRDRGARENGDTEPESEISQFSILNSQFPIPNSQLSTLNDSTIQLDIERLQRRAETGAFV